MEAISSKSCLHAFVPDKMIEIEIDRKHLNYNKNLKFMPFGKSFHFYAIWELCHLGSYRLQQVDDRALLSKKNAYRESDVVLGLKHNLINNWV